MARRASVPALALAAILASASAGAAAEGGSPWSFHAELDLWLGLRAGAEYAIDDAWGIRACAGPIAISPLTMTYSLVCLRRLTAPGRPFRLDLVGGLLQDQFNLLEPVLDLDPKIDCASSYWGPGLGVSLGWRLGSGHVLSLCLGAGFRFGWDNRAWQPPEIMPDLVIGYGFKPAR